MIGPDSADMREWLASSTPINPLGAIVSPADAGACSRVHGVGVDEAICEFSGSRSCHRSRSTCRRDTSSNSWVLCGGLRWAGAPPRLAHLLSRWSPVEPEAVAVRGHIAQSASVAATMKWFATTARSMASTPASFPAAPLGGHSSRRESRSCRGLRTKASLTGNRVHAHRNPPGKLSSSVSDPNGQDRRRTALASLVTTVGYSRLRLTFGNDATNLNPFPRHWAGNTRGAGRGGKG